MYIDSHAMFPFKINERVRIVWLSTRTDYGTIQEIGKGIHDKKTVVIYVMVKIEESSTICSVHIDCLRKIAKNELINFITT